MIAERRFVIDTNVSVSAAFFKGSVPDVALTKSLEAGKLLMSADTLRELEEVLHRPKFTKFIDDDDRDLFISKLVAQSELICISVVINTCRDPKDNKFLELAISGQATHIVSGDKDLLVLNPFHGVAILTPQQFLSEFQSPL